MNNKVLNKDALKAWILSKMVTLTNNLLATTPGVSAMDAAQGPVIQGQIEKINSNLGGLTFGTTEDGQPGFRKPGADTVHPFKSSGKITINGTIYADGRYESGGKYIWATYASLNFAIVIENEKINTKTFETSGNLETRSYNQIKSRIILNSITAG